MKNSAGKTLYDKIWESHLVKKDINGFDLLYVDFHLIHEVTTPTAFDGLNDLNLIVRRPEKTLAVADHNITTSIGRSDHCDDPESALQLKLIRENTFNANIKYFGYEDPRQGIVHVVAPEQGITQPGMTIVCGDSHASTHGAFGVLAFGICSSEVEHVLATQTLMQKKSKNMRVHIVNNLMQGVTAKDLILTIINKIGTAGATGYVVEFTGKAIFEMSMEQRMTVSNMAIELGARAGLMVPDATTYDYLKGREYAPAKEQWVLALNHWKSFYSDDNAKYDKVFTLDASQVLPMVTWGTSPEDSVPINGNVPLIIGDTNKKSQIVDALEYMGLMEGQSIKSIKIDRVFIGSCTNGRIEDLRVAAKIVKGKKISKYVKNAMVVPGSGLVKKQAEKEGLDKIFLDFGFEWREPGCSMCLGMNPDKLLPGERCASTSNRNFKGRQGFNGRTHLVSPENAAMAAIYGRLIDSRTHNQLK